MLIIDHNSYDIIILGITICNLNSVFRKSKLLQSWIIAAIIDYLFKDLSPQTIIFNAMYVI